MIRTLLGLDAVGGKLRLRPCLPSSVKKSALRNVRVRGLAAATRR
jgi:hypothetical protein